MDKFRENANNPRKSWSIINSLLHSKNDSSFASSKLCVNDQVINNPTNIANTFNERFRSIGTKIACKHPSKPSNLVNNYL